MLGQKFFKFLGCFLENFRDQKFILKLPDLYKNIKLLYRTLLCRDFYSLAGFKDWRLCTMATASIRQWRVLVACSAERFWRLLLRTVAYDTSRCVDAGSNKCCCAYVCVPLGFKAMMKRYRGLPCSKTGLGYTYFGNTLLFHKIET